MKIPKDPDCSWSSRSQQMKAQAHRSKTLASAPCVCSLTISATAKNVFLYEHDHQMKLRARRYQSHQYQRRNNNLNQILQGCPNTDWSLTLIQYDFGHYHVQPLKTYIFCQGCDDVFGLLLALSSKGDDVALEIISVTYGNVGVKA